VGACVVIQFLFSTLPSFVYLIQIEIKRLQWLNADGGLPKSGQICDARGQ
jgi:hypothetical protein